MLKQRAANHICLGRGDKKTIKLKKARLLDWPAETDLHSRWQQRAVYIHCWQSFFSSGNGAFHEVIRI